MDSECHKISLTSFRKTKLPFEQKVLRNKLIKSQRLFVFQKEHTKINSSKGSVKGFCQTYKLSFFILLKLRSSSPVAVSKLSINYLHSEAGTRKYSTI